MDRGQGNVGPDGKSKDNAKLNNSKKQHSEPCSGRILLNCNVGVIINEKC